MSTQEVPLETWRQLYALAQQVKELAPWEFMWEHHVFGVQDPVSGELGFVSVMGGLGEYFAVMVYRGTTTLGRFAAFQQHDLEPTDLLLLPRLMLAFESRNMTTSRDRKVMKALGLRFRGKHAWPWFRRFQPLVFPDYLNTDEARLMQIALEQLLALAPRIQEGLLDPYHIPDTCLVRVYEDGKWKNRTFHFDQKDFTDVLQLRMDMQRLAALQQLPRGKVTIEADLVPLFNMPVRGEKGSPDFWPLILLLVDHHSNIVLGSELLSPLPSLRHTLEHLPIDLVKALLKTRQRPKRILTRLRFGLEHFLPIVSRIGSEIGVPVQRRSRLPRIEQVIADLEEWHARREW